MKTVIDRRNYNSDVEAGRAFIIAVEDHTISEILIKKGDYDLHGQAFTIKSKNGTIGIGEKHTDYNGETTFLANIYSSKGPITIKVTHENDKIFQYCSMSCDKGKCPMRFITEYPIKDTPTINGNNNFAGLQFIAKGNGYSQEESDTARKNMIKLLESGAKTTCEKCNTNFATTLLCNNEIVCGACYLTDGTPVSRVLAERIEKKFFEKPAPSALGVSQRASRLPRLNPSIAEKRKANRNNDMFPTDYNRLPKGYESRLVRTTCSNDILTLTFTYCEITVYKDDEKERYVHISWLDPNIELKNVHATISRGLGNGYGFEEHEDHNDIYNEIGLQAYEDIISKSYSKEQLDIIDKYSKQLALVYFESDITTEEIFKAKKYIPIESKTKLVSFYPEYELNCIKPKAPEENPVSLQPEYELSDFKNRLILRFSNYCVIRMYKKDTPGENINYMSIVWKDPAGGNVAEMFLSNKHNADYYIPDVVGAITSKQYTDTLSNNYSLDQIVTVAEHVEHFKLTYLNGSATIQDIYEGKRFTSKAIHNMEVARKEQGSKVKYNDSNSESPTFEDMLRAARRTPMKTPEYRCDNSNNVTSKPLTLEDIIKVSQKANLTFRLPSGKIAKTMSMDENDNLSNAELNKAIEESSKLLNKPLKIEKKINLDKSVTMPIRPTLEYSDDDDGDDCEMLFVRFNHYCTIFIYEYQGAKQARVVWRDPHDTSSTLCSMNIFEGSTEYYIGNEIKRTSSANYSGTIKKAFTGIEIISVKDYLNLLQLSLFTDYADKTIKEITEAEEAFFKKDKN